MSPSGSAFDHVAGPVDAGEMHHLMRWHLVFTKPACEQVAKINLERQSYRVYYPRLIEKARTRGRWRDKIGALFPRYLFVQLNTAFQSLAPVRSTVGVAGVVRFGTEYVAVPDGVVDDLIRREDSCGLHRLSFRRLFAVGAAVRIVEGALAGMEAVFEAEKPNDRVTVLLKMLGRETRIQVTTASVVPAY